MLGNGTLRRRITAQPRMFGLRHDDPGRGTAKEKQTEIGLLVVLMMASKRPRPPETAINIHYSTKSL